MILSFLEVQGECGTVHPLYMLQDGNINFTTHIELQHITLINFDLLICKT